MLGLPPSVRTLVVTQLIDGRKGADSLMTIVRDLLAHDPLYGPTVSLGGSWRQPVTRSDVRPLL